MITKMVKFDLQDINDFIKGIKQAFYENESILNYTDRYALLKGIVILRMKKKRMQEKDWKKRLKERLESFRNINNRGGEK